MMLMLEVSNSLKSLGGDPVAQVVLYWNCNNAVSQISLNNRPNPIFVKTKMPKSLRDNL